VNGQMHAHTWQMHPCTDRHLKTYCLYHTWPVEAYRTAKFQWCIRNVVKTFDAKEVLALTKITLISKLSVVNPNEFWSNQWQPYSENQSTMPNVRCSLSFYNPQCILLKVKALLAITSSKNVKAPLHLAFMLLQTAPQNNDTLSHCV